MATESQYKRNPNGNRLAMGGFNTVLPADALGDKFAYAQNVRAYTKGRTIGRATQGGVIETLGAGPVHSMRRLNDTTPLGPAAGFSLIAGSGQSLYCNATSVSGALSGNAVALVPFRPNSSPQPWMYVADSNVMLKVRSDGLTYKMGIKEPQGAPNVGVNNTTVSGAVTVLGTARPWSNVSGANSSYNYGDNGNGTGIVVIATPTAKSTLTLTASGTVTIGGTTYGPGSAGPVGTSNPGRFVASGSSSMLLGAWTDANGNIVAGTGGGVISVGSGKTLTVPAGAVQFQLGVDGTGGAFAGNTGSFAVSYTINTPAIATVVSLLGEVTAYYWGDSPHSGPVASYIWRNAGDSSGSGPVRDISNATGSTTNNSLIFDQTPAQATAPMAWAVLDDTGAVTGSQTVFQPALESQGYQDFNMCVVANLLVPAAGTYTFTATSKDGLMWGIGNNATWPGQGTIVGAAGQTETVVSKCPLLPAPGVNGTGPAQTVSVVVSFPGPGVYPIELDYDYWYHSGRTLVVQCNNATIPPLSSAVKQDVSYRYRYRSSQTGAKSNPSPASPTQSIPAIANSVSPLEYSPDPQVDKVDFFRMDKELDDFTYVGTGPNTNPPTPFTDTLLDTDVAGNDLLEYDNFEPFPSIDLPRKGIVSVIGGVVTWVSGDQFNLRWLPGGIINIGGIAYSLYSRPTSATTLLAVDVQDGTNLVYEFAEPTLAGQPMASMWGDTDNTAFVFACGDKLRPGTLYWSKGNDLDSAPDTNQQDVTSPSEPLVNGVMANGTGMVFSAENGWMIYPNFSAAIATVTGTQGSAFSVIRSSVTRGLFIRSCICTNGSGGFFYRSKEGIEMSAGGGVQKSLTDDDLYNLFSHEKFSPVPIVVAGFTIYPPDDTRPEKQRLSFEGGFLYYDYQDATGTPRTLVLDVNAGGWVVDAYATPVTYHMKQEGPNASGVLVGCLDGTVRALGSGNVEAASCVVVTGAQNNGDARAQYALGDIYVRALVQGSPVSVALYTGLLTTQLAPYAPTQLAVSSTLTGYILDPSDSNTHNVSDLGLAFTWPAGTSTLLDLWQPTWTTLPETTQDRPTDWTDAGGAGAQFWQGLILEADTFNVAKHLSVQSSDDLALHTPDQSPVTFNGQSKQALTFTPPFIAHSVRIVASDGVPWNYYQASWVTRPFPEATVEWQTEMSSFGNVGWMHVREFNVAHISTTDLTLTLLLDVGAAAPRQLIVTIPNSGGLQVKTKVTMPPNKFKLMSRRLSSSAPFRVFQDDLESKVGAWGRSSPYSIVKGIGGPSADGATV